MHRSDRLNKDDLHRLYIEERKSLAEIARPLGVSKALVGKWLRAAGIPARSISEGTSIAQTGRPLSEQHKASLRINAANARAKITRESHKRGGLKRRGLAPPNKGKPMSPELRARLTEMRQDPEYRAMMAEKSRGEKSNFWRGGVTDPDDLRMQGWEWRQRRREVYERDKWTCQECQRKCLSAKAAKRTDTTLKIQAHHIIRRRDGGTDELSNLVTLCMGCHMRREARYSDALFA